MRADDFGWLVGGFFTIVLPWYFKNKKQNDVVKIGWHIFLKDIMDYAAIRRES